MTIINTVQILAERGFHVFRLKPNAKTPYRKGWQEEATCDTAKAVALWEENPDCNIGIYTGKFKSDKALVVIDVDNKGNKKGDDSLCALKFDGHDIPETVEQSTTTGGSHIVYETDQPLKQGANVLGDGLDIRSRGGYIVAFGSTLDGKKYEVKTGMMPTHAPKWLVEKLSSTVEYAKIEVDPTKINKTRAMKRAIEYLTKDAPVAQEGDGGDDVTYRVAARVKDIGLSEQEAFDAMSEYWNEECSPPWDMEELEAKIRNAYQYGQQSIGADAPETHFDAVEVKETKANRHPFEKLNDEYAFVISGGSHHILWETTDEHGDFRLDHLAEPTFHKKYAWHEMQAGKKTMPVTRLWLNSKECRRYDGLVFDPSRKHSSRFYNTWRGFKYEPMRASEAVPKLWQDSLDKFLEHALLNVCEGDQELFKWLMGWFAQMVQYPEVKPLTALVMRGGKGVGKNALVERVGALFGAHSMVLDDNRYLTGNFNSHLESNMFAIFDEAFWSGDKNAEGKLKGLITGKQHIIERKGKEPYTVANLTRVAILGNEEWLVPASEDERRFAVFNVGDGRKQDRNFFIKMREGMEAGGYRLLLSYLLNYDLSKVDVNKAPITDALTEQKHATLEPFAQWWLECVETGYLVGAPVEGHGLMEVNTTLFRDAFIHHMRDRQIRTRLPNAVSIGLQLKDMAPSFVRKQTRDTEGRRYVYSAPSLSQLRSEWESFIGAKIKWREEE